MYLLRVTIKNGHNWWYWW